jgi:hypothetical protein
MLGGFPPAAAPARGAEGVLLLESGYPVKGIPGARRVAVRVKFRKDGREGRGHLILNRNWVRFNVFGDMRGTTAARIDVRKVRFAWLRARDRSGQGRQVYRLAGKNLPGAFWLVVPGASGKGGYRLVYAPRGPRPRTVIVLESPGGSPRRWPK